MKRRWLTVFGILFTGVIILLGRFVPELYFQVQEQDILWGAKEILIQNTAIKDQEDNRSVTQEEYADILQVMYNNDKEIYHEPVKGQLSMTQALNHAAEVLEFLYQPIDNQYELPFREFNSVNAVLKTKIEDYENHPEYSYWEIKVSNHEITVKLWMNAVSGKVLDILVEFLNENITNSVIDLGSVLQRYVDHIGVIMQPVEIGEETMNSFQTYMEEYYKGKYISCYGMKYLLEESMNFMELPIVYMRLVVVRNQ